jgi:hypothetical protein
MSDDITTLARDVARPFVDAAIARHGHLSRPEFEKAITAVCASGLDALPPDTAPIVRQFIGSYIPAAMLSAYDGLHAPAAGRA